MSKIKATPCLVYVLKDPRNSQPVYVGITNDLGKRLYQHFKAGQNLRIDRWSRELTALGMKPAVLLAYTGINRQAALCAEKRMIEKFVRAGYRLFNRDKVACTVYDIYRRGLLRSDFMSSQEVWATHRLSPITLGRFVEIGEIDEYRSGTLPLYRKADMQKILSMVTADQ